MKQKIFLTVLVLCCIAVTGYTQVIRPFAHRYHNTSVRGNVIYVSNSIISTSGLGTGNPGTGEAPPGGTTKNNGAGAININVDGTTFIPFGATWKYWANNQANYQANWQTVAYNDAAWPSAATELGYGDGDEATCIPSGGGGSLCSPSGNKWAAYYFRKTVNIANPLTFPSFTFNVERDDGFVLYINGVEYQRNNMPVGAVTYATSASSAIEDAVITFTVPNTAFVSGNNVIAVEMHQSPVAGAPNATSTSSDISFNLQLTSTTTFSSSSADLSLPGCSSVLWAGLYWGAGQGTDGTTTAWITGETTCKLKVPGASSYTTVNSTTTDYHNAALSAGLNHTGYKCFADITSLVNTASPNGTYMLADVVGPIGISNGYGGWTIVIAYQNPSDIIRELNVYDGNVIIDQGQPPVDINLSGFNTPPTGPVSCELGAVVFDGDRGSIDAFSFKQSGAPTFLNLTPNATSNLDDMWNSTISYKGSVVTTRSPSFQNTVGYDADIIDLPNAANANLGNNQTAATVRLSSTGENYVVQVVTATISIKEPYMQLRKNGLDVNGGSLVGGDELRYTLQYANNGSDSSLNTYVIDTIPTGTTYKTGSILIGGVPKTDVAGDDEAEFDAINNRVIMRVGTGATAVTGGRVLTTGPTASGTVNFSVLTSPICVVQSCSSTITNQGSIYYTGATSGDNFISRSGAVISGCFAEAPTTNLVSGLCRVAKDTILANICPASSIMLPYNSYIGYRFYTGMPFSAATAYNHLLPVTSTHTYFAFYDGPGVCDDTLMIRVFISSCPDIDDDNDGIPDYVEIDNPLASGNHDADAYLNWNDATYPGFIDNNTDGFNDNFDPSADSDNDGIPNFIDPSFPGWVDSNVDGVNDTMDKDLDGIPNHLDLDSDNDGIPDVAESFGVDVNGDGRIDGYLDTDNDGLSQNVDFNGSGVTNSGLGLGALDTDGDGIGNYLDLDSDNDGIPDITEVYGTDAANSARISVFTDLDGDGYADAMDADVGNDAVAENSISALLKTGVDGNNDGRCDSWPNINMDNDSKPNPYDLDSDGDGISDVKEAGFLDGDWNGRVDGALNSNGRNIILAALGSLSLPNSDASGRLDPFDIDADNDGIPDNVEGTSTLSYQLPSGNDSDGDGIDNTYDNFSGFGGDGIHIVDTDGDTTPDFQDTDTDGDGSIDRIEGNDLNLNGLQDDLVTLTGVDTDGDGLDDRFDNNNSSAEATSARMGNGGTITGDPTPGSTTTVQHTVVPFGCATERDWRCLPYILSCEFISFKAVLQNKIVTLDWTALCRQDVSSFVVERSTDRVHFTQAFTTPGNQMLNEVESYTGTDNISGINEGLVYYRLRSVMANGRELISNIIAVRQGNGTATELKVLPNPVNDLLQVSINVSKNTIARVTIMDAAGRVLYRFNENLMKGSNTLAYSQAAMLNEGMYFVQVEMDEKKMIAKFNKLK